MVIGNTTLADAGSYLLSVSNVAGMVLSSNAVLTVLDTSTPLGDGIPNWWKQTNSLSITDPTLALSNPPGDKLTYFQKFIYGLNATTPDTDDDGLSDYDELFKYGTNPRPLFGDTDGDGMPDKWELEHGLNPRVTDGGEDLDHDGLTNRSEFDTGSDPRSAFSIAGGLSDHERATGGKQRNQFFYDRNDRLVGAEYDSGLALAYVYDGNDNLVRQVHLARKSETNGLPVLWSFLNGLPAHAIFGDADGDGWSNWQEWKAGTSPVLASSRPDLLGNPGTNIASLTLPFIPTNFVVGVGQLDGSGPEEIVIGGDGDPGTSTNFLMVLTQEATAWTTQWVDVGPFGITSIAVGQVTNRPGAGIYVGLRGTTNGSGRVMEFTRNGGIWQSNVMAVSTNQVAFALGVRAGNGVFASLATTNAADGVLHSFSFSTNWIAQVIATNTSHRGLGSFKSHRTDVSMLRLLDTGGISINSYTRVLPINAVYRAASGSWFFQTPTPLGWSDAEALARSYGGYLASISDVSENDFLQNMASSLAIGSPWIGLNDAAVEGAFVWSSGEPVTYANWGPSEPNNSGNNSGNEDAVQLFGSNTGPWNTGKWNDMPASGSLFGVIEVPAVTAAGSVLLPEPSATRHLLWRGTSLASGTLRGTNGSSAFYAFTDDKNTNDLADVGDDFLTAEYVLNGTNVTSLPASRHRVSSLKTAQSYGLASVNFLNSSNDVFFTGEPDGQVFAWTSTGTTNPLQRQLFSGNHAGKAWHALAGVKTLEAGEGLIGLRVDPSSPNKCDVILWPPQVELPQLASLPNTAPAAVVLPSASPLGSFANVSVRLWDAEGNAATPQLQFQLAGSPDWRVAMLEPSVPQPLPAMPSGTTHTLVWNAVADLGTGKTTNVMLRARAADMTLLGDWSVGTPFRVATTVNPDSDGDGMLDAWEVANGLKPGIHDANGNPDGDGLTNLQEFLAGTDPQSAASNLALRISRANDGQLRLEWDARARPPFFLLLERQTELLPLGVWQEVLQPDLVTGLLLLPAASDETYFRLRLGN